MSEPLLLIENYLRWFKFSQSFQNIGCSNENHLPMGWSLKTIQNFNALPCKIKLHALLLLMMVQIKYEILTRNNEKLLKLRLHVVIAVQSKFFFKFNPFVDDLDTLHEEIVDLLKDSRCYWKFNYCDHVVWFVIMLSSILWQLRIESIRDRKHNI